jgi:hypothetical protein
METALVVEWSEFQATDPEVPGSILGAKRFFWEIIGLEWGPLSLLEITEEVDEWKKSNFSLENQD